jgi:hypothetical protein
MRASRGEERGLTMWITQLPQRKATFVGHLFRGGALEWCPDGTCLILIEEPSIEYMRIKMYGLSPAGPRPLPALGRVIWNDIQKSIGENPGILFSGLEVVGWLDQRHALIVAQARYVQPKDHARVNIFGRGYVVDVASGTVVRRVSATDLKTAYNFVKRIV